MRFLCVKSLRKKVQSQEAPRGCCCLPGEALTFRCTVLVLLCHSTYCTSNILFALALSRWRGTGRDSNSSRHDLKNRLEKQAEQIYLEYKATERGELLSFAEDDVI